MQTSITPPEQIRKQFVDIAQQLALSFPDLDLRFNLTSGTQTLRYMAADVSDDIYELPLGERNTQDLLYEAIFTIKELARHFDA